MRLKDNTLFELPPLLAGSFGRLDRLEIPYNILMLREVIQREDNGDIELICQAKDGPEEKRGGIRFFDDDRVKKDQLFQWLQHQIGKDIETIYGSSFGFRSENFMAELKDLLERIDEALNNLEGKTTFNLLHHKNLLPVIRASLSNFQKSNNPDYLKSVIDEFHKTAIATTEGADAYNNDIWDASIEVKGKQVTLEELFDELEDIYLELYNRR